MARLKKGPREAKRRDRSKWKGDRYVPISPSWLRAEMLAQSLTVSELARRTAVRQQTLDAILKSSEPRTMRASRRAAIAKALGVAEEVLAGEAMVLAQGTQLGYEYAYSARTWRAAERLLTKSDLAARRDLERASPRPSLQDDDAALSALDGLLRDLMEVGSWRERLLRWTSARPPHHRYREPLPTVSSDRQPLTDVEHEEGVLTIIRAIEHVLTPWFDDHAMLDYVALSTFTGATPARHTKARVQPTAVFLAADAPEPRGIT